MQIDPELKAILKADYINSKDMISLIIQYQSAKNPVVKDDLRNKLFENNVRLIRKIVSNKIRHDSDDIEDVFNSAVIEFFHGLEKFDTSLGNSLSTYIVYWIENAVHKYYYSRNIVYIPKHNFSKESANLANASRASNSSLFYLDAPLSRDGESSGDGYGILENEASDNPEENTIVIERNERIQSSINKLTSREQCVVRAKFFSGIEITTKDVTKNCGLCEGRVRIVLAKALVKLSRLIRVQKQKDERQFKVII